jgi:hypothetical protein
VIMHHMGGMTTNRRGLDNHQILLRVLLYSNHHLLDLPSRILAPQNVNNRLYWRIVHELGWFFVEFPGLIFVRTFLTMSNVLHASSTTARNTEPLTRISTPQASGPTPSAVSASFILSSPCFSSISEIMYSETNVSLEGKLVESDEQWHSYAADRS